MQVDANATPMRGFLRVVDAAAVQQGRPESRPSIAYIVTQATANFHAKVYAKEDSCDGGDG